MNSLILQEDQAAGLNILVPRENKRFMYGFHQTSMLPEHTHFPSQVYMIGGKTGTTTQAGSCLILLTKNKDGEEFISVVLKGVTKSALYHTMTDILSKEN